MDGANKKIVPSVSESPCGESAHYSKFKILVIDDEPANTDLLEAILSDSGYERVKSITDSRVALDVCRTFKPDLILLDLMMPHVDGFAILSSLRSEPDEVFSPVIVLTADETEETKLRTLDAGATDLMLKPFDLTEILLRIKKVLATRL